MPQRSQPTSLAFRDAEGGEMIEDFGAEPELKPARPWQEKLRPASGEAKAEANTKEERGSLEEARRMPGDRCDWGSSARACPSLAICHWEVVIREGKDA